MSFLRKNGSNVIVVTKYCHKERSKKALHVGTTTVCTTTIESTKIEKWVPITQI